MVGLKGKYFLSFLSMKPKLKSDYGRIESCLMNRYTLSHNLLKSDYGRIERLRVLPSVIVHHLIKIRLW